MEQLKTMSRKKRPPGHRWLVVAALLVNLDVTADEWPPLDMLPSLKLLEYLGSLVDGPDGLIGPEIFAQESMQGKDATRSGSGGQSAPKSNQTSTEEVRYYD